jgi:hypothetical protein
MILALMLLNFLFFYGCDSSSPTDDDNPGIKSGTQFSPPAWLHGTWRGDFDLERFIFSHDNVIWITFHGATTNNFGENYNRDEIKQDIITDTEYKFTIVPQDLYFHFNKISSSSLSYWTTVTAFSPDTLRKID